MGWWAWTCFRGQTWCHNTYHFRYHPVHNPLSAYNQQGHHLYAAHDDQAIEEDLITTVWTWLAEGDQMLLGVDANNDVCIFPLAAQLVWCYRDQTKLPLHCTGPKTKQLEVVQPNNDPPWSQWCDGQRTTLHFGTSVEQPSLLCVWCRMSFRKKTIDRWHQVRVVGFLLWCPK